MKTIPDNWVVEITPANHKILKKWRIENTIFTTLYIQRGYIGHDGKVYVYIPDHYDNLISFEDFQKHVNTEATPVSVPDHFHVMFNRNWTEDFYNALHAWGRENGKGSFRGWIHEFPSMERYDAYLLRFNFHAECFSGFSYGMDNHTWNSRCSKELTLEQVKTLINYKPSTNGNKEGKQTIDTLETDSRGQGGKTIAARTKRSRNLCKRGSIDYPARRTQTRRRGDKVKAKSGDPIIQGR